MRQPLAAFPVVCSMCAVAGLSLGGPGAAAPQQTACGKVQKVTCDSERHVTTLELKPKSKAPVTIPPESRGLFVPAPEELYRDTDVCATGQVEMDGRHRRLVVSRPEDITVRQRLKPPEVPLASSYARECDEGVQLPVLIREVKPNYTHDAMTARITGVVVLEAIVSIDGLVGEVRVRRSLDAKLGLDEAAVTALRQWRFKPGTKFGQPVPVLIQAEISFQLK